MSTLTSILPKPQGKLLNSEPSKTDRKYEDLVTTKLDRSQPPSYRNRLGWKPKRPEDFGDGGAYPEIHIAQYPLEMGRTKTVTSGGALPLQVDAEGNIQYDDIAKQGHSGSRIIHSHFKDLVP